MRAVTLSAIVLFAAKTQAVAAEPAAPSNVNAAEAWKGVKVLPKLNAIVKVGNEVIDANFGLPWIVQDAKDGWLLVGDHRKGWVQRSQVVTLDDAVTYYSQLIDRGQKRASAFYYRGIALYEKRHFEQAIADFGERLRLEPDAVAYMGRGALWVDMKEYDKALDDFNQAIRLGQASAFAYNGRASVWFRRKDYDKAIDDFSQVVRLDPTAAFAYYNRGLCWYRKKNYDKAIADFNEVMRLDPNDASVFCGAAWIRATCSDERFRNGPKAITLATRACELRGWADANDLAVLAAGYAEAGDFDGAIKRQAEAIEMNVSDAAFVKKAGGILELFKDHKAYRE